VVSRFNEKGGRRYMVVYKLTQKLKLKQDLNAIDKDGKEENNPTNMSCSNMSKEIRVGIDFREVYLVLSLNCCRTDLKHPCSRIVTILDLVRPVSTVFLTARITIAAALASRPDVGSSMKMIDGLATNSTAMVSLFLCSVDRPSTPGRPTRASFKGFNSTKSITSSTNIYKKTSINTTI
ncbi:hypothetical protein RJ640_014185, partial [Escallonia rubra]